jgi:hypothetical protein
LGVESGNDPPGHADLRAIRDCAVSCSARWAAVIMTRRLSPWRLAGLGERKRGGEWVGLISGTGDWILVGLESYGLSGVNDYFSDLKYVDIFELWIKVSSTISLGMLLKRKLEDFNELVDNTKHDRVTGRQVVVFD